jgi:uncharacterized repeat protein (TIGR01451 family)
MHAAITMKQLYASILRFRVTFLLTLCLSFSSNAQYYTIPDANFAAFLNTNYPGIMNGNQLDTTANVSSITSLQLDNLNISNLDGVVYFDNLLYLFCSNNQLTNLPDLPTGLVTLRCHNNSLTYLQQLPQGLGYLDVMDNQIESLPILPSTLENLDCRYNPISVLPDLPQSLLFLDATNCELSVLPQLPTGLIRISVDYNHLLAIPELPQTLEALTCDSNLLTVLPELPGSLTWLTCSLNQLTGLPALPETLGTLWCHDNQITALPNWPSARSSFDLNNNQIHCFDSLPEYSGIFQTCSIDGNPLTCLPNFTLYTTSLGVPLCLENDPLNNPGECAPATGIAGTVYIDDNTNCNSDPSELGYPNAKVLLHDDSGNFLALTYTNPIGAYYFPYYDDDYVVTLDTTEQVYTSSCVNSTTITAGSDLTDSVFFFIDCNSVSDLAVMTSFVGGNVFPGQAHSLYISAGNLFHFSDCSMDSISGTFTMTVEGPITYYDAFSYIPTQVNGNTLIYEIDNVSEMSIYTTFIAGFIADTTVQIGDTICVTATISILSQDPDTLNNTFSFCYEVGNSYDPNYKAVSSEFVEPGYDDFLTYTIHFQNTGTAPAIDIRLEDTLSNYLDFPSFELLSSSHPVTTTLSGNRLSFLFENINLADSTSNEPGSHGFVQYRIKPISGLPVGSIIPNTASIYFDYNAPIVTNTATTTYSALSVNQVEANGPIIYPNPSSGLYHVKFNESIEEINVFNLSGEHILQQQNLQNNAVIDLGNQPAGVYLLKMNQEDQTHYIRLVKL